jgi:NAD(P)-dependent dehydrogenase (short-subunit alcohol dehydrogenase family)
VCPIGTAGIGAECVVELAKHIPAQIYFTGRNAESADAVVQKVNDLGLKTPVNFIQCDLASLATVRTAAESFLASESRLDFLVCNAGIAVQPPGLTSDGYEIQFGTNHLGHALLIKKLLPTLLQTARNPSADVRLIILTSQGLLLHPAGGIIFTRLKTTQETFLLGDWRRYGQSKLANFLYAAELARRHPEITTVAIHPGIVYTDILRNMNFFNRFMMWLSSSFGNYLQPHEGAYSTLWALGTPKEKLQPGGYYEPVGVLSTSSLDDTAKDDKLARQLWDWTELELSPLM